MIGYTVDLVGAYTNCQTIIVYNKDNSILLFDPNRKHLADG